MTPSGAIHTVYDRDGNLLMESNGLATGITREYIWLPGTQIAPATGAIAGVPRPIAVVDAVNTASPATWWVHTDHLNRPVQMTDGSKATLWQATWLPFGAPQAITGTATLDARFPGQWFQLESGLHQNWWRHYDPNTGRYTQPDPLGFVDGPSVYGYANQSLLERFDLSGRLLSPPRLPKIPTLVKPCPVNFLSSACRLLLIYATKGKFARIVAICGALAMGEDLPETDPPEPPPQTTNQPVPDPGPGKIPLDPPDPPPKHPTFPDGPYDPGL